MSLTEFTLDDFRLDLARYIEANRAVLEAAACGLYAVVPPHPDYKIIGPGVIFCLRQETTPSAAAMYDADRSKGGSAETINPLKPYFLVYVLDDGNVRFGFAHPKQILEIYRLLCAGKSEPYKDLCNIFDQQTEHASDMSHYNQLLKKGLASIQTSFQKRAAANLVSSRSAVLPLMTETPSSEGTDFDLITWLVILQPD